MKKVTFTKLAFDEYNDWFQDNPKLTDRIKLLVHDISQHPFTGIGKPEPLKGNWAGYWSRRINEQHRLIYSVENTQILIVKCKGHY